MRTSKLSRISQRYASCHRPQFERPYFLSFWLFFFFPFFSPFSVHSASQAIPVHCIVFANIHCRENGIFPVFFCLFYAIILFNLLRNITLMFGARRALSSRSLAPSGAYENGAISEKCAHVIPAPEIPLLPCSQFFFVCFVISCYAYIVAVPGKAISWTWTFFFVLFRRNFSRNSSGLIDSTCEAPRKKCVSESHCLVFLEKFRRSIKAWSNQGLSK